MQSVAIAKMLRCGLCSNRIENFIQILQAIISFPLPEFPPMLGRGDFDFFLKGGIFTSNYGRLEFKI
jgi:hypothetical protein